jgi:three-Cys-motif partner protein
MRRNLGRDERTRFSVYYLTPYLQKIAAVRRPIVVVDAFAGPGAFRSGDLGSPLIIANAIQTFLQTHASTSCRLVCVERDPDLHAQLASNLQGFRFSKAERASFLEFLPRIEQLAVTSSVFIYADPFAIDGLEWDAMDRVFKFIGSGRSVELLLNFNAGAFVRRARAALSRAATLESTEAALESTEEDDDASPNVATATLDRIVGGSWWRTLVTPHGSFSDEVNAVADGLRRKLQARFGEAGMYDVRPRLSDSVPKYYLVFASRHPDALCLVNEAVCKDREREVGKLESRQLLLFDSSSEELPSAERLLKPALLRLIRDGMRRRELQITATRELFGLFREKTIRTTINDLCKRGVIRAEPNTRRLNDESQLFRL